VRSDRPVGSVEAHEDHARPAVEEISRSFEARAVAFERDKSSVFG
jgi:hypothetical protein